MTFKVRTPKNRDEAIQLVERLCVEFDIQQEEDFLTDVISTLEAEHQEALKVMWLQVVGAALEASGKEFISIDTDHLMTKQPYNVTSSTNGNKTRYRLVKDGK